LPRVPNGLAFSCRERAQGNLQKTNDLVREAVGCNAGLDRVSGLGKQPEPHPLLSGQTLGGVIQT